MLCVNKNLREYQTLKKLSGLSDFVLSAYVGDSLDTLGRYPYLDELPEADSSKAISEDLSLNKDNVTKTENILLATNTKTVEEAVPELNNKYRDKEIEILEVGNKSRVYITTRPNEFNVVDVLELKEFSPEEISKEYQIYDGATPFHVYYNGNKIGLILLFDNNNITIKGMYIDPEYRNKGIGKLLYKTLIERAYSRNGSLYSDPEQISDNAIRVWESLKKQGLAEDDSPIQYKSSKIENYENINSFYYFNEIIDKLQTLYGINIIPITNAELSLDKWASITGTKGVKSFIYNGNIYINTDIATVDSPVHEFLHLLFGSMKYLNRALYDLLVGLAEQFDSYKSISKNYPNRTVGDINEEVFVTELARYLTGQSNAINNLSESAKLEIIYNINRTLDTVLMGDNSVKCVSEPYNMSLKSLAQLVNSSTMISEKRGSLNDATLNRIMANTKSELMKNKELREECE